MIYKFKLEVCDDNNKLIHARGEEGGLFWRTLNTFLATVLKYAKEQNIQALK